MSDTADIEQETQLKDAGSSKPWLDLLDTSERAFDDYQTKCDSIDKLYANLNRLASNTREREFQLFWANVSVLGPSVYSRPPIPVVTTRFKDRDPLKRTSAEVLERITVACIDQQDINGVMLALRNDVNVIGRGVPWVRLGEKDGYPWAFIDHVDRRDFRHDPVRQWRECDWVARCAWLTKKDARRRFSKTSGQAYKDASYTRRKTDEKGYGETDTKVKAPFWELWSKSLNKVVWVSEGVENVLDESDPYMKLEGFFPCPEPAYGTLQRNTLIPVPDVLFYKDQLEEIDQLTGRIAALSDSLKVRGFYPAGAGNISDAIEAAVKSTQNNTVLIPVSNWAALGGAAPKDMVMWWPIDQVAATIKILVELRKQLIDDVYQIIGLSDIMRGSTSPSETLGAQELKSQYGSVRIRDRQAELVRIGRDVIRIVAEIVAENYSPEKIAEMSQMDLPSNADILAQIKQLQGQGKTLEAAIQQNPAQAQEIELQAVAAQIDKLGETITIDAVTAFLRDNQMRCFSLEIETDSTVAPDENATKQRATEYVTAMAGLLQQAVPAVAQVPQMAPLMAEMITFANKQFRIGRSMESVVEEFADQMKAMAQQPRPDPGAAEAQQSHEAAMAKLAAEGQNRQAEIAGKLQSEQAKAIMEEAAAARQAEMDKLDKANRQALDLAKLEGELALKTHIADGELALKQTAAYADIGLKAQKELMNAEQAAQAQAEKAMADGDAEKTVELSALGEKIAGAGEAITAAALVNGTGPVPGTGVMKRGVIYAAPPDNTPVLEAIAKQTAATEALFKVIAAPQQLTSPEGRVFTSKRIIN